MNSIVTIPTPPIRRRTRRNWRSVMPAMGASTSGGSIARSPMRSIALPPLEDRRPLLGEGAQRLLAVAGSEHALIALPLEEKPLVEGQVRSPLDRPLREPHRDGPVRGDDAGQLERRAVEVAGG